MALTVFFCAGGTIGFALRYGSWADEIPDQEPAAGFKSCAVYRPNMGFYRLENIMSPQVSPQNRLLSRQEQSLAIPSRTTVTHQFLNVFCRAPIRQQDAFFCFSQISGKTFTENSVFAVRTSLLQTRKSVCAKCAYDGFFSFLKRLLNSG